ncbi:glycosyltransferase [Actinoplanes sp. NPDC051513]|uniref:glycosyltransferase n=1 Tax=Actinoplanes sp. NPDC051513 TaxID=3363908 RepID=UPI0037ABC87C
MKRVLIISASIGAGHDGCAAEIARRLQSAGVSADRVDYLDLLPTGWGRTIKQTYARQLAYAPASWGWLLDAMGRPGATRSAAWLAARAAQRRLLGAIQAGPYPAAVVSTYPLASQALGRLRQERRLSAPAIAVLTDPAVHPLCVAPGVDLHLAPNDEATGTIIDRYGLSAFTHAPLVHPAFRQCRGPEDVVAARQRLGLPLDARLALVVAGSWGVGDIDATVNDLIAASEAIPVVVCGRNDALRERLATTGKVIALGWVDDMPSLLHAADVVVQNAGGLTSMEALASNVPLISYRCLPGHGVANAAALERLALATWPRTVAELGLALRSALRTATLPRAAAPEATTLILRSVVAR